MNRRSAALSASFAADSLSLGPHWIYNQSKVTRLYPEGIREFDDPRSEYHPHRRAGQFTHYGDQALTLLRSLALRRGWSESGFREDWLAMWDGYDGYVDGATKATRESQGASPSDSNDLAGASRLAPLVVALAEASLEDKVAAARAQTALTHGDANVIDAAEFFLRATESILDGRSVTDALEAAAQIDYETLPAREWLAQAREAAAQEDPGAAAAKLGLTCHIPEAFPATLLYLLKYPNDLPGALDANAMAGGDTSARGMLIGLLLGAAHGFEAIPYSWVRDLAAHDEIEALLTLIAPAAVRSSTRITFPSADGDSLDAAFERPAGPVRAIALFAHCFTCGKNNRAAVRISRALATEGIATLRFDFTGLGSSGGDFANTSFVTNVDDLIAAASYLREHHQAPALLIGHSLGGAAVLAAAGRIPEATGVATIGAPADPGHVTHLFGDHLPELERDGVAEVSLAGRSFRIGKRFLDDIAQHCQACEIAALKRDLLIMHAPADEIVGLDNAGQIYQAAKHPKSFLSLAGADHLLTAPGTADYVARVIAAWASRLA